MIADSGALISSFDELPQHIVPVNQLFAELPEMSKQAVSVFPKPFNDVIHLSLAKFDATGSVSVSLINLTGAVLFNGSIAPCQSLDIPAEVIPKGLYLLKVTIQDRIFVYKLTKG